jgi:malate-CoA ligase subunit alpha
MIAEISGPLEAEAAAWVRANMSRPVIGHRAELAAPMGRRMGHVGAIIAAPGDSTAEKADVTYGRSDCRKRTARQS